VKELPKSVNIRQGEWRPKEMLYQFTHPWHWLTYGQNASGIQAVAAVLATFAAVAAGIFAARAYYVSKEQTRQAEVTRQRSDTTCAGVTEILSSLSDDDKIRHLWAGHYRHAGFAFNKSFVHQLPEYLRRKCDPFSEKIAEVYPAQRYQIANFLLVFRFPYPNFDVVLDDVRRLNFGSSCFVWDDEGRRIAVPDNMPKSRH
jgi:hypothetical protein